MDTTIELTPAQYRQLLDDQLRAAGPTCEACNGPKGDNQEARENGNPLICDPCMDEALAENAHSDGVCDESCPLCE